MISPRRAGDAATDEVEDDGALVGAAAAKPFPVARVADGNAGFFELSPPGDRLAIGVPLLDRSKEARA